ncbi:dihydrolipoamide acetyltransferase family protein [Parabacteroides chinchillae]|uniref:Dihydrolipoamide acetyltransferase component of pyruvate dehydrogenase complex n=1 Tax=Parabacteroides chinchillae TaxID=871327 RepID=A0A8G2BU57_9BACT|nr:dihydrolipoamide acetyltransferase family protein [Parabacteroides chinchillae]SEF51601.1 2-oxoglutarate dehydrogenase E2 component (dihydrolipoamide succinyltransferase) [Parabacteroides chinchillae]
MALFEIKMPKLGESITEGTIIAWSVKVGDNVQEDDVLFEVSTAKVSAEIPSPIAGKVAEILFNEGDTVAVGIVVAKIQLEGEGEESNSGSPIQEKEAPKANNTETNSTESGQNKPATATNVTISSGKITNEDDRWYSPVVLQIAKEAHLSKEELDQVPGSGYLGRLSKKDIKEYVERKKNGKENAPAKSVTSKATPAPQSTATAAPSPNIPVSSEDKVIEMDRVRRIIADHMVLSKKVSPHVTSVIEVDVTKLVKWRDRTKDNFFKRENVKLTYMPAITEATAKALAEYPLLNSSVDSYKIILKKHINIGVAVSLNDGNLIVPVIQDADKLNLNGLAVKIDTLATQARDNKLSPDNIQGGTFTITNFGTFKSLFGTPIINQPQVAILAVGYIEKKPAVVETPEGDTIAIRHKMYLSLSYDHRIVDGALAGAFLRYIADYLENWNN